MSTRNKKAHIPEALRREVLERDNHVCVWCYSNVDLHIDHIIPEYKESATELDNLRVLCKRCNLARGCSGLTKEQVFMVIFRKWARRGLGRLHSWIDETPEAYRKIARRNVQRRLKERGYKITTHENTREVFYHLGWE